jgi:hypothetical protein
VEYFQCHCHQWQFEKDRKFSYEIMSVFNMIFLFELIFTWSFIFFILTTLQQCQFENDRKYPKEIALPSNLTLGYKSAFNINNIDSNVSLKIK